MLQLQTMTPITHIVLMIVLGIVILSIMYIDMGVISLLAQLELILKNIFLLELYHTH